MVSIHKDKTETVFEMKGLHKIWAFRNKIKTPNTYIKKAYFSENEFNKWHGIRIFGTGLPGVINAGNFYNFKNKELFFLDIVNKNNVIVIELENERFKKLIISVENPTEALKLLNGN